MARFEVPYAVFWYVCFSDVYREEAGELLELWTTQNYDDMKYAIGKLDDSQFRNAFSRAYIRVREYDARSRSRSGSRSYSRSPSYSRIPESMSQSPSPLDERSPSRSQSPVSSASRGRSVSRSPSRRRSISRSQSPVRSY